MFIIIIFTTHMTPPTMLIVIFTFYANLIKIMILDKLQSLMVLTHALTSNNVISYKTKVNTFGTPWIMTRRR